LGQLPAQVPALYMRHNLADDGTSHTGSLSDSPDIILKNNPVANPQTTFSTPASISSDTESDSVITGRANYVYLRAWNRGSDAPNVFATVYWSPPATLVTPDLWTLIGSAYHPDVPLGSIVQVSNPGIVWPTDQLPGPGHYCFVAMLGNAHAPAPNLTTDFATFDDFVNYIYANNNITWRNFNVLLPGPHWPRWDKFIALRFLIAGAWDKSRHFAFETHAELPNGSQIALQVPEWIGHGLKPTHSKTEQLEDAETDPKNPIRLRIPLAPQGRHSVGKIELPAGTRAAGHLLVQVPDNGLRAPQKIIIRQLYNEREVGRITWLLSSKGGRP
jgi:serine protease